MSKSKQQTTRKVAGRIARHKNVRYHNDAKLFVADKNQGSALSKPAPKRSD